jgi:hypothetical protein
MNQNKKHNSEKTTRKRRNAKSSSIKKEKSNPRKLIQNKIETKRKRIFKIRIISNPI